MPRSCENCFTAKVYIELLICIFLCRISKESGIREFGHAAVLILGSAARDEHRANDRKTRTPGQWLSGDEIKGHGTHSLGPVSHVSALSQSYEWAGLETSRHRVVVVALSARLDSFSRTN